jgi:WG containing repeat
MKHVKYIFCLLLLPIFSIAEAYNIFEDNGKVGLKNESGKVLIPAKYEALGWSDGEFSVLNNATGYRSAGKWGLISLANHILTKAEFEEISPADASLLIVRKKSPGTLRVVAGAITSSGKEVIPFQYDDIKLSSLRAIVFTKIGNQYKYGLIDLENKVLIPQQFKNIRSLGSLRYAAENFDGKWALFTDSGRQITNFTIDNISSFQKQYAIFYSGYHQGLMDRDGIVKIEPKHQEIKVNEDGSVYSRQPATWLFLDGQNKLHQKVQADSISEISKNLFKLNASGTIQLIDYNLKPVSATRIHTLENFINGKAIFSVDQRYGVIRSDGTIVVEPKYSTLKWDNNYFLSNTRQGGKDQWILLDSIGKPLHTKSYDFILPYNGQFFPVITRNFWGAITPSGKEILSCTYDSILQQLDNNIVVKFHGQYGIVNQAEVWLVAPRSKKIRLIAEDRFLEFTPKTTYLKSFDNSIIYFSENKLELRGNNLLEYLPSGTI